MRLVHRFTRSPFAPVAASAVAGLACVVRWVVQGSSNMYTALDKRFYVPDADLGWRVSADHPVWLGLDACAVVVAMTIGKTLEAHFAIIVSPVPL